MRQIRRQELQWQLQLKQLRRVISDIKKKIRGVNRRNDLVFDQYTRHMLATLYHEGFHAFLDQFLFEEELAKHVPRWLNEGLAQYFEVARLEGRRLVLGQEDRAKLAYLRAHKRKGNLVPIEKMVTAGAKDYMVHEIGNLDNSTKHYLQAWCLVHLLGEKKRLKKENCRAFVKALADGREPMDALPLLTGVPNAELKKEWKARLKASIKFGEPGSR